MSTISTSPERRQFAVHTPDSHRGSRRISASSNQHPYAIKTTSTALLTRSNSSGHVAPHQHLYIPTTPSPSPAKHRHSKSELAQPVPRPLPIPPALESPSKAVKHHGQSSSDGQLVSAHRTRAETLPPSTNPPLPSPVKLDDLPSNPRVWTTSQLASYLVTALRVRSGEALPLPLPVAKDVAAFVKQARLNGRAFLRLNEQDLQSMEINNLWRDALLNASRNLRQNVLKGRIWGFEPENANDAAPIYPFRARYNSSSSSISEVSESQETTPQKDDLCKGSVRRALASLERTSSSGSGPSNRGSNTSDGEIVHGSFSDEEAAFASGSEASEAEERRTRDMTRKRIFPQTPFDPKVESCPEPIIASPDVEPSVEELLEANPLSNSWGAKAWEDMSIGDTVKHIGGERQDSEFMATRDVTLVDGDAPDSKGLEKEIGGKAKVDDIFSRPLPSRPLPTPPKSASSSPSPRKLVRGLPVEIAEKSEAAVQVDSDPQNPVVQVTAGRDVETEESDSGRLKNALALLELYRKRLDEAEAKIAVLSSRETEDAIVYVSKAVETESILRRSQSKSKTSPSLDSFDDARNSDGGGRNPESSESESHASKIVDLRGYVKNRDWDPLDNGVPSYVLMVGVGVCAVVLSTLLKRFAGRKP